MNDQVCRQWADYLLSVPPEEQVKVMETLPKEAQGKILASLSTADQSRFLTSVQFNPAEYMKYHQLIQQYKKQQSQIPLPPSVPDTAPIVVQAVPVQEVPVQHNGEYRIFRGRLDGYKVKRLRKISPVIWVCEVIEVQHNPSIMNFNSVPSGVEVIVHTNEIYDLTPEDYVERNNFIFSSQNVVENEQSLRIGSWNIRCTGDFQRKDAFVPELLERFERLAYCINHSKCQIVALQEFPMNFEHNQNKLLIEARDLLPEFIYKLNKVSGSEWGFGYSEDFPQDSWKGYRKVKDSSGKKLDYYPSSNGEYIHAFIFKKEFIEMHSVEQVLDMDYQENRFKHAPSLGRFTFMDNFNFSLCNVHLRPAVKGMDSRHEIEDLGKCIDQLSKYNPESTIILGDFNMSACRYAPETTRLIGEKKTEFQPHYNGVWESFDEKGYNYVIRNRYTNKSDNMQFDNIWLPKELYPKADTSTTIVNPPGGKAPYEQTNNVIRLQSVFTGTHSKDLIEKMTDHHLIFVDLKVDVSEKSDFIKKVFEIDNSKGLKAREYDGFYESKAVPAEAKTPENEKKKSAATGPRVSVSPGLDDEDEEQDVSLKDARKHFMIWDKREQDLKKVTVKYMGGSAGKEHWAFSLFPKELLEKPKDEPKATAWTTMKELETSYFEFTSKGKELQSQWDALIEELKSPSPDEKRIEKDKKKVRKEKKQVKEAMENQILPEFEILSVTHFKEHIKQSGPSKELFK